MLSFFFRGLFKESPDLEFILTVSFVICLTFTPFIIVYIHPRHLDLQRLYFWINSPPLILEPLLWEPAWWTLFCLWIIYFIACVFPRIHSISLCHVVSYHLWNCKYSWLNIASGQTHCGFCVKCLSFLFTDFIVFICMFFFTQNKMSVVL